MSKSMSKSSLAIVLSRLGGFESPKVRQEQYIMDSEIGASALWNAYQQGDIGGRVIADLGCGPGMLGIGALLLGTKQALFVDSDEKALETAKNNISKLKSEGYKLGKADFICKDIEKLEGVKAEVVVQNPPFGTKVRHIDAVFLKKALEIAPVVYSFHKSETKAFLERFSAQNDTKITHFFDFKFPIKATFEFHRRKIRLVNVTCFRFVKNTSH